MRTGTPRPIRAVHPFLVGEIAHRIHGIAQAPIRPLGLGQSIERIIREALRAGVDRVRELREVADDGELREEREERGN